MKKLLLLSLILVSSISFAQNKKEKAAMEQAKYEAAIAAITAKDFVIIPDTYEASDRTINQISDVGTFLACEISDVYTQGTVISGGSKNYKMSIQSFETKTDKKGNVKITIELRGSQFNAKVDISMRNGSNYADVIFSTSNVNRKFSGEIIPRSKSNYMKRSNYI